MKTRFKNWFRQLPFYPTWRAYRVGRKERKRVRRWKRDGCPSPPPQSVKQKYLIDMARNHNLKIFVETGTYRGDTLTAVKDHFERVFSIELCPELARLAEQKFNADGHVEIIQGDSGSEMINVMAKIDEPALFWLDGHYSAGGTARGEKDTPIMEELSCILNSEIEGHVIVIDDARCFGSDPAYPTYQELEGYIRSTIPSARIRIELDNITVTTGRSSFDG